MLRKKRCFWILAEFKKIGDFRFGTPFGIFFDTNPDFPIFFSIAQNPNFGPLDFTSTTRTDDAVANIDSWHCRLQIL